MDNIYLICWKKKVWNVCSVERLFRRKAKFRWMFTLVAIFFFCLSRIQKKFTFRRKREKTVHAFLILIRIFPEISNHFDVEKKYIWVLDIYLDFVTIEIGAHSSNTNSAIPSEDIKIYMWKRKKTKSKLQVVHVCRHRILWQTKSISNVCLMTIA